MNKRVGIVVHLFVCLYAWLSVCFNTILCVQVASHVPQQVPAGLFIPTMFFGACMGRVLGIGIEQLS